MGSGRYSYDRSNSEGKVYSIAGASPEQLAMEDARYAEIYNDRYEKALKAQKVKVKEEK